MKHPSRGVLTFCPMPWAPWAVGVASVIWAAWAPSAHAALLPQAQNQQDLEVMVAFIRQHDRVAITLKSIDFQRRVVHFDAECKAEFGRKPRPLPPGAMPMIGPAEPLVFIRSNCSLKDLP